MWKKTNEIKVNNGCNEPDGNCKKIHQKWADYVRALKGNHTLEKQASYNLNIMRVLALNILKLVEVGSKALSIKKKRSAISTNPEKHLFFGVIAAR